MEANMHSSRDDDMFVISLCYSALVLVYLYLTNGDTTRSRRWWVSSINLTRPTEGEFATLYARMRDTFHDQFYKYTRMEQWQFQTLLELTSKHLQRKSIRTPLPPELRLAMTLKFLAHGGSMHSLAWNFRVGTSTARKVVKKTCSVLWNVLHKKYLKFPQKDDWLTIAEDFWHLWNFPNCAGALDGKHIAIRAPPKSGSEWYCYKQFHSVVLLAACDAHYRFIWVDCGGYGSRSDSGLFGESTLGKAVLDGSLDLPTSPLPGSDVVMPHWFVGDAAFPLKPHLMKPYGGRNLNEEKDIFNYRLSRARRMIENSFGILCSRWRLLLDKVPGQPQTVATYVLAAVCLHNYVMVSSTIQSNYCPLSLIDREDEEKRIIYGTWRETVKNMPHTGLRQIGSNNSSRSTMMLRDNLCKYLVDQGAVEWQEKVVKRGRMF